MSSDESFLRYLSALLIRRIINRARHREYYNSHKEQCRNYVDPEKVKRAVNNYYKNHPEKVKERVKRWRENNHDRVSLLWKRREYRERNAEGDFTLEEWNAKLKEYNYRCAYCGSELNSDTVTIDHKIPLSREGTNYIENIAPSCKTCNSKKYTKTPEEYLAIL